MGLEVTKQSIAEWISITRNEGMTVPITLHTTSGSMLPTIRIQEDAVLVVPCGLNDVRPGDIVLIRNPNTGAGVLLHRLYRIKNGRITTLGDHMRRLDREENAEMLLGRALSVTGPGKHIDCESPRQRLRGKMIVHTYHLRPFLFFARRAFRKFGRVIRSTKAHG